jgi:hypothetical protein
VINSVAVGAAAVLLVACGGGGGGSSSAPVPVAKNETAAGLWETSYLVTSGANIGNTIRGVAIVSPTGTFYSVGINVNNGCAGIGFGQLAVTGSTLNGNSNGAVIRYTSVPGVNVNCALPDGSPSSTGTVTGTVTSGKSMVLSSQGKTSKGLALSSETATFNWSHANSVQPSLALVAGTYKDKTGVNIAINSQGVITSQDPTTGCAVSGTLSIPSASYNVYDVSFKYSNCAPAYAALNNLVATGLGTYDNSTAPTTFTYAANATVNGTLVVVVEEVVKQ